MSEKIDCRIEVAVKTVTTAWSALSKLLERVIDQTAYFLDWIYSGKKGLL